MPQASQRTQSLFWSGLAIAWSEERAGYLSQACGD